jgi:hypothetical protein
VLRVSELQSVKLQKSGVIPVGLIGSVDRSPVSNPAGKQQRIFYVLLYPSGADFLPLKAVFSAENNLSFPLGQREIVNRPCFQVGAIRRRFSQLGVITESVPKRLRSLPVTGARPHASGGPQRRRGAHGANAPACPGGPRPGCHRGVEQFNARTNSSGHTKPWGRIDGKTEPQLVRPAATNANAIPLRFRRQE